MQNIDLNYNYSKQQIRRAYQFHYNSIFHPKRDTIIALVSLGIAIYFQNKNGLSYLWTTAIVISILFMTLLGYVCYLLPYIIYQLNNKFKEEYHLTLTNESLFFKTNTIDSEIKWSLYTNVKENKDFVFLYYGKHSFTIIPKKEFNCKADLAAFIKLIEEKIPRKI